MEGPEETVPHGRVLSEMQVALMEGPERTCELRGNPEMETPWSVLRWKPP